MRTRTTVITVLALLMAPAAGWTQQARQSSADLLQTALYEQEVRGDLESAVRLYKRILADHADDRPIAARALVELATAYETLGNRRALETYRSVLSNYPDQARPVERARVRIAALAPATETDPARSDGVVARQLWVTPAGLGVGALSPDGQRAAFVDWGLVPLDELRGHADAAYYDIGSGTARLVTDRPSQSDADVYIASAIWSPDGRRMAYALWDTTWTHMDLYTIGVDGGDDRILVDNEQFAHVQPMEWSSAIDAIATLVQGWDDRYRITLIDARDGSASVVKTLGEHQPANLSLSPDARFIVYEYPQEEGAGEHDIFLLAADGSSETRLAAHPADDQRPFFTPDGQRVVFTSTRSGQAGLWAVAVRDGRAAGEPMLVRPDIGAAELLGFTRDGGLYYRVQRLDTDIHQAELDLAGTGLLTEIEPLTTGFVGRNLRAAWSPDGTRVAFLSRRGSGPTTEPHLVIRTLATAEERAHALPFRIFAQDSRPVWTEDASAVLIEGGEVGSATASAFNRFTHRVDVATGEVETQAYRRSGAGTAGGILRFATERQEATLERLGVRIAGQRDRRLIEAGDFDVPPGMDPLLVRNGIHRVPGGDFARIESLTFRGHMHAAELSPDGGMLALALPSDTARLVSDVLYVSPITGGPMKELARVRTDQEVVTIRWLPDASGLLYAAAAEAGEAGDLWYAALDGTAPRRLDLPITARELAELEFHPDGRRVTLTRARAVQELWLMEGFPWQRQASR